MQPGKLDRRITLYRIATSRTSTGESKETTVAFATVWARRAPLRGTERWVAHQVAADVDERFIIRWRPNISPITEVGCGGRRYEVTSVLEVGRREGYEILATARAENTATPR